MSSNQIGEEEEGEEKIKCPKECEISIDWDYKRYPNNPFARTRKDKLLILLAQLDEISDRNVGTLKMWKLIRQKNLDMWEDRQPKTYSDEEFPNLASCKKISEEFKNNIAVGRPFDVAFIEIYTGKPSIDCSIEIENFRTGRFPLVYFTAKTFTKILTLVAPSPLFLSNVRSKEEIEEDDLDFIFYQVALTFHHNSFRLCNYKLEAMWIDIAKFPMAKIKFRLIKI